jgi:hypothetical protein
VQKALNDQACFGKEYDFKKEAKSVYVLKDECTMGVSIERDCGGKIPAIVEQWEEELGLRQVPRLERAEKLGITVAEEEGTEKEEKGEDEEEEEEGGVEMYLRVDQSDSYVVPQMGDIAEGLEKLFFKQKGEFVKDKFRVELVWLTLPFPEVVERKRDTYEKYDVSKHTVAEEELVKGWVKLALSLLTEEGVLVVVAPLGTPEWWILSAAREGGKEAEGVEATPVIKCRTVFCITADEEVSKQLKTVCMNWWLVNFEGMNNVEKHFCRSRFGI